MEEFNKLFEIYRRSKDIGLTITEWDKATIIIRKIQPKWKGETLYDLWAIVELINENRKKKGLDDWISK